MILTLDSIVSLEKHSGRTLNEIICGFSSGNEKELMNNFLQDYVDFFSKKTEFDILLPEFFKNSFYKKKILANNNFKSTYLKFDSELEYMKSIQYVNFNLVLINPAAENDHKIKISHFLKQTLSSELKYIKPFYGSYENRKGPLLSKGIKNCFADPEYISWCILNLDFFAIDRIAIEKKYETSSLLKMDVIPINHELNNTDIRIRTLHDYNIYYDKSCSVICKPILERKNFQFSESVKEKNYENLKRIERKDYSTLNNYDFSENQNDYSHYDDELDDDLKTYFSDNPDNRG